MIELLQLLKECGVPSILVVFGIAVFLGARGIFLILKQINTSLVDLSTTLKILVEQNQAMMKMHDNEIDRLLGMIERKNG